MDLWMAFSEGVPGTRCFWGESYNDYEDLGTEGVELSVIHCYTRASEMYYYHQTAMVTDLQLLLQAGILDLHVSICSQQTKP
jgi:hypothetical protein